MNVSNCFGSDVKLQSIDWVDLLVSWSGLLQSSLPVLEYAYSSGPAICFVSNSRCLVVFVLNLDNFIGSGTFHWCLQTWKPIRSRKEQGLVIRRVGKQQNVLFRQKFIGTSVPATFLKHCVLCSMMVNIFPLSYKRFRKRKMKSKKHWENVT